MTSSATSDRVLAFGAHILDTLVRPVEAIPPGQSGSLVEQIKVTAAGPAAATALVMSRLGARVRSAGVVGDDATGDFLLQLLSKDGVDTTDVVRVTGTPTSATVLPIRRDGSRPALHVIGTNALLPQNVPWDRVNDVNLLHLGGPEFLGGELAGQICARARSNGALTSADSLAPPDPETFRSFADVLPHLDFLLPNDEQVLGWTGESDLAAGCMRLVERGVRTVVATAGDQPTVIATPDGVKQVPTFEVDVVDTTGCGDSFSAGFLRAILLGKPAATAAVYGNAVAAHVAQGLGSDFGDYNWTTIEHFIKNRSRRA